MIPFNIFLQQKLTELRQWSEKVRNFDHNFHTSNGLFFVDCSHIHDILLPRLNDIYSELVTFVAEEAKSLAKDFCNEMKTVIEVSTFLLLTLTLCGWVGGAGVEPS